MENPKTQQEHEASDVGRSPYFWHFIVDDFLMYGRYQFWIQGRQGDVVGPTTADN